MGVVDRWPALALRAVAALGDLALPMSCASCAAPDERAVPRLPGRRASAVCGSEARDRWRPPRLRRACPSTFSAGRYDGALSRIVSAYKDDGRRDCAASAGRSSWPSASMAVLGEPPLAHHLRGDGGPVLVVPVPTSRGGPSAAWRRSVGGAGPCGLRRLRPGRGPRRRRAPHRGDGSRTRPVSSAARRAVNLEHSMQVRGRWRDAGRGLGLRPRRRRPHDRGHPRGGGASVAGRGRPGRHGGHHLRDPASRGAFGCAPVTRRAGPRCRNHGGGLPSVYGPPGPREAHDSRAPRTRSGWRPVAGSEPPSPRLTQGWCRG